jgi:hypothetical protein
VYILCFDFNRDARKMITSIKPSELQAADVETGVGPELECLGGRLDFQRLDGCCANGLGNAVRETLVDEGPDGD